MAFDFSSLFTDPAAMDRLLNQLAMSPIDPNTAMEQIQSGAHVPQLTDVPPTTGQVQAAPSFQHSPLGSPSFQQMLTPGVQFGPNGEVPGGPGVQLPSGGFPGGPQVPGLPQEPVAQIGGPGVQAGDFGNASTGGQPPLDVEALKRALTGLAGMQPKDPQPRPYTTLTSNPQRWADFKAAQFQTPTLGQRPTLAQLLYGR